MSNHYTVDLKLMQYVNLNLKIKKTLKRFLEIIPTKVCVCVCVRDAKTSVPWRFPFAC